ncbi:hypothetical protein Tsubulata_027541 [Turnera subulata]|uniref:SWIM-type domain-containing protein n=1 Tax=Turnera subulata TaxID=218843 RepID=A0A9Q0FU22_9ROSI|nr:hypothetical protein Tsubulata_027541 [Turnera subulata]
MRIDTKLWARHKMSPRTKCELLLNNLAETFNSLIMETRDKPILTMLEGIRMLMRRFARKQTWMNKYQLNLCPRILQKLEKAKKEAMNCIVIPGGSGLRFEVNHCYESTVICDLDRKSCFCNKWEYTGILCYHACAASMFSNLNPEDFVDECYTLARFKTAYALRIEPVPGQAHWPELNGDPCKPPCMEEKKRRFKKPEPKRRGEGEDRPSQPHKLTKRGGRIMCQNCLQYGHNIRTCSNPRHPNAKPPKAKRHRNEGHSTNESIDESATATIQHEQSTTSRPAKLPAIRPIQANNGDFPSTQQSTVTSSLHYPNFASLPDLPS